MRMKQHIRGSTGVALPIIVSVVIVVIGIKMYDAVDELGEQIEAGGMIVIDDSLSLGVISASSGKLGSNTSSSVTSTAHLVMAASTGAQYRILKNVGNADITWSATTTGLAANLTGHTLTASSSIELYGDKLYLGDIYAVTEIGSTSTLQMLEL